jgi:hypothetical protein
MGMRGGYVSLDDLDAEIYGEPHQSTVDYLREKVERYASRARDVFGGFFEDSREVFERYNGDAARRRIRARVRKTGDVFKRDVIRPLRTLEDIQHAKPTMQRYVMANIMVRMAEEAQQIDGYSDSYRNEFVGRRGFKDPDYMRVIDGIIFDEDRFGVTVSDDPENAWVACQNLFEDEERDLDVVEQADILSTWDIVEMHLQAKKKDPTSVLNENL